MKNNKEAQALRSNLEIFGRPSGKYSRSIYDAATQYLKLLEGSHVLVPVEWISTDNPPRDGWRGLVFMDMQAEGFIDSRDYQRIACYDKSKGFLDKHCGRRLDPQPTHWMPLPKPPTDMK